MCGRAASASLGVARKDFQVASVGDKGQWCACSTLFSLLSSAVLVW